MLGQSSVEYFVIIALALIAISIITAVAWQENEIATRVHQTNIAVKTIASSADNLYAQGPGAKSTISVILPAGYSQSKSSINGSVITFTVNTPAGYVNVIAITKANITGSPPTGAGMKIVELETIEGYVNITGN